MHTEANLDEKILRRAALQGGDQEAHGKRPNQCPESKGSLGTI